MVTDNVKMTNEVMDDVESGSFGKKTIKGDLSNGGRGIRNQLEARLLNPLSRALFDQDAQPGERFLISALDADGLTLERR